MSILPKKLFLPIKSKQDADKLIAYLSNVKPKERYSFGDCLKGINNIDLENYFRLKANEFNLYPHKLDIISQNKPSKNDKLSNAKSKVTITIKINPKPQKIDTPDDNALKENRSKGKKGKYEINPAVSDIVDKVKKRAIDKIIASDIPASGFIVTDGCITYGNYSMQSVKISAIPNKILNKITHKFTIEHDYFNKNLKNQFKFKPATDLSLLLAEAEKHTNKPQKLPQWSFWYRDDYPQYGKFELPWENVKFRKGEMLLTHPNPSTRGTLQAYKFRHPNIVSSFNDIMPYISERIPKLTVTSNDGVIVGVENFEKFKKAIPQFLKHVGYIEDCHSVEFQSDEISSSQLRNGNSYTLGQLRRIIKKSPYLTFLSKNQIKDRNIFYILEYVVHEASSADEFGYIFTVKERKGITTVIYENTTDESRSSLVFLIYSRFYDKGIKTIRDFLASDRINKRQTLSYRRFRFDGEVIADYQRVIHNSQSEWQSLISAYLY
jgi:hypothetical protein